MTKNSHDCDVTIIGAGPSGSVAAGILRKKGYHVIVLEREHFPRFVIGESLLPQSMVFIEEAGMLDAVNAGGFQVKNGAFFHRDATTAFFDFREKFSPGPGTTYQVPRAQFDKLLADEASRAGADIRYGHSVTAMTPDPHSPSVTVQPETGDAYTLHSRFVLDASGYGRVLSRLLNLELPSELDPRKSVFTHIIDNALDSEWDREKIVIAVHPQNHQIWYWLIPFTQGRASVGAVLPKAQAESYAEDDPALLRRMVKEEGFLNKLLRNAEFDTPVRTIEGYSCKVKTLHGPGFALLGDAGEFLDPVFSSGVTIAMKSASLAAHLLEKQFENQPVNWEADYAEVLMLGVNTFRAYVNAWYTTEFQDVIFSQGKQQDDKNVREMISSILAGYVWDRANPLTNESDRRLRALAEICRSL